MLTEQWRPSGKGADLFNWESTGSVAAHGAEIDGSVSSMLCQTANRVQNPYRTALSGLEPPFAAKCEGWVESATITSSEYVCEPHLPHI